MGCLLRALIVDEGSDAEPIPERRLTLGRGRAPWSGYQRRALLTLADRATDEAPLRRPPARRLAADIHDTVPSARLADDADPFSALRSSAAKIEPSRRTRLVTLAAIGIGLVLLLLGIIGLRGQGSVAAVNDALASPSNQFVSTCSASDGPVAVDFDDDGCPDPVRVEGAVVVVGTHRFAAGVDGDRVVVGDWNCDGVATAAVLRPSTGDVYVFDSWANDGRDVSVSPTRTIVGATDVHASDTGNGCSTLVVSRADGTEEEIG